MLKHCSHCKLEKQLNYFYKNKSKADGLHDRCKECIILLNANKYADSIKECKRKYYQKNKKQFSEYQKIKKRISPNYKLGHTIRNRILKAINGSNRPGSAIKDLGCTVEFLVSYLEGKFESGMTWENHGQWHIDHIKPLASFDLTIREQFLQACHYTNLQPLWAKDNLAKGAR